MGNEVDDNKFTWVIKNFPSLGSEKIYSDVANVADIKYLQFGWRRYAKVSFTIVNQFQEKLSLVKVTQHWFDKREPDWGFAPMINLGKLESKNGVFLVDGEVKVVVEVDVLNVSGESDVPEETEEVTQRRKKIKMNGDGVVTSGDLPKETPVDWVDVNGFQVLPSQRIFEKHPEMALEFRAKNQNLKTACMNVLLNLIDTLCQSLQDLSIDDLVGAESALTYVKDSGFKVGWLEQKLVQVKEKKKEEQIGVARIQELEEELKDLKQKCSDKEALVENEKAKVLATIATPLRLDDVV